MKYIICFLLAFSLIGCGIILPPINTWDIKSQSSPQKAGDRVDPKGANDAPYIRLADGETAFRTTNNLSYELVRKGHQIEMDCEFNSHYSKVVLSILAIDQRNIVAQARRITVGQDGSDNLTFKVVFNYFEDMRIHYTGTPLAR